MMISLWHIHVHVGGKLFLRVNANGEGADGDGTHVSLYCVLMKGEHDAIDCIGHFVGDSSRKFTDKYCVLTAV